MKLLNCNTNIEVKPGDEVLTFRGEKVVLESFDERRVYCRKPDSTLTFQWYPSVINCKIQLS